jgi:CDP-diacylglycerol--glycerol-3-phosphate 3-phosphatidyltransferase
MSWRQLLWPSNLLSLARIILAVPLGYCLSIPTREAKIASVVLLILAGLTDALDGYVARRTGRITSLGTALDPIADKVFAALFMVFLILYRDFPLWLAAVLIGRDLLLLFGGIALLSRGRVTIPARLYGKYLFFATVFLLGSYVIEYRFGATLSTVFVLALCAVSLTDYIFVFSRVVRGEPLPPYDDKPRSRALRLGFTALIVIVYIAGWFVETPG